MELVTSNNQGELSPLEIGIHALPRPCWQTACEWLADSGAPVADVKIWMAKNQFGRRNLQPFQRAELALKIEPLIAEAAKERIHHTTTVDPVQNSAQAPKTSGKTRDAEKCAPGAHFSEELPKRGIQSATAAAAGFS